MLDTRQNILRRVPLHDLHVELGAKMVPFAGYEMPVQYPMGVKDEHLWTREHAGLFDVSHMGPCILTLKDGIGNGDAAHGKISALIEQLVPSNIAGLKPGQARLTVLLNESGGILDDLIITRPAEPELQGTLYIVVNGAVKEQDWALFNERLGADAHLARADDRILVALQGPKAEAVLAQHFPDCADLSFMQMRRADWKDEHPTLISRCGYTGEDGFEILAFPGPGRDLVDLLLSDERVKPIGLGARDSLRLEAGLCLYGHDMDPETSPVEADLAWVIQKKRRERADFPGAERILQELTEGPVRKRVGIKPLERAPAREGTDIVVNGEVIGIKSRPVDLGQA